MRYDPAALLWVLLFLPLTACRGCSECDSRVATVDPSGFWTIEGEGKRIGCANARFEGEFELGPSMKIRVERLPIGSVEERPSSLADLSVLEDSGHADSAGDLLSRFPPDLVCDISARREASDSGPGEAGSGDGATGDGATADGAGGDGQPDLLGLDHGVDGPSDIAPRPADAQPDRYSSSTWPDRDQRGVLMVLRAHDVPPWFSFSGEVIGNCVTFQTREELDGQVATYYFAGKWKDVQNKIEGSFSGTGPYGCAVSGDFEVQVDGGRK